MALQIRRTIADPMFQSNCYIVFCDQTKDGIISDPGKPATFNKVIEEEEIALKAIVNTHAHLDHVFGVAETRREYDIPFHLHRGDELLIENLNTFTANYGLPPIEKPEIDEWLTDGQTIFVGSETIKIIHTPGHSPGGCCLHFDGHLIVGDTIFAGSVGRSDLPGGDHQTLIESIHSRILTLPPDTVLYPGHGPSTTVAAEAASNPFLQ